ncbi:MAG: hypothetical protein H6618_08570 [Deltaproteobacteria bacterium]|nr:hypothetical protein [Deltaproteobacteria bacterium]
MSSDHSLIRTQDGSLSLFNHIVSESYHSKGGALQESQELYIKGSGIRRALLSHSSDEIAVLDVGLGAGYNANTTIDAWQESCGLKNLRLCSLEKDPFLISELISGNGIWQKEWSLSWRQRGKQLSSTDGQTYTAILPHPASGKQLIWEVLYGDASRMQVPVSQHRWHFIWQDPFSPTRNQELWTSEWFSLLKRSAAEDCVLMSYSVARSVKDALQAAGWLAEKIPASQSKRSWLKAIPLSLTSDKEEQNT